MRKEIKKWRNKFINWKVSEKTEVYKNFEKDAIRLSPSSKFYYCKGHIYIEQTWFASTDYNLLYKRMDPKDVRRKPIIEKFKKKFGEKLNPPKSIRVSRFELIDLE